MFKDFGISEADWNATLQSVKTVIVALQHQARLLEIRFSAYEQKLSALEAKDAEIESLKTEVAALRERLGQNFGSRYCSVLVTRSKATGNDTSEA